MSTASESIRKVLLSNRTPLTTREITNESKRFRDWSRSTTPQNTISAALNRQKEEYERDPETGKWWFTLRPRLFFCSDHEWCLSKDDKHRVGDMCVLYNHTEDRLIFRGEGSVLQRGDETPRVLNGDEELVYDVPLNEPPWFVCEELWVQVLVL